MGVDLRGIVYAKKTRLESFSGRIVAIDAYNAIYQFLASIRGESGEPLRDRSGNVTSHLTGLFYRNVNLVSLGIRPVYVLDGKPPEMKGSEIERRRQVKKVASDKYKRALTAGDLEGARKYARATSVLQNYMREDAKRILSLLGIPCIEAPSEGEATAAHLTRIGLATDAASQDYDSILFGAKRLLRNLTLSGKRKLPNRNVFVTVEPEEVELSQVLSSLGLRREQLVDIGILMGTDFNPNGFPGVGPATALKYIRKYGQLEDIPEISEGLGELDYPRIREIFLNPSVTSPKTLSWGRLQTDKIVDFLCGERDFSEERVRRALDRLEESEASKSESLERWFG